MRSVGVLMAVVLGWCAVAGAQISLSGPQVNYTANTELDGYAPGQPGRAVLSFTLSEGWHVNANKPLEDFLIPTELKLKEVEGVRVVGVVYPDAVEFKTKFQDQPLAVYEHEFKIGVKLEIAADAAPGTRTLEGSLRYQACNDSTCAPPKEINVTLAANVLPAGASGQPTGAKGFDALKWEGGAVAASTAKPEATPAAAGEGDWRTLLEGFTVAGEAGYSSSAEFIQFIDDAEKGVQRKNLLEGQGFWGILLAVLVGGFLLNLTPCVLPLIPINLAILGAGARAGSKARGFTLGMSYGLGIALIYGGLGLLVVLGVSSAFGGINATVWFNLGIAVLFVVLGLAMFDVIQIDFSRFQAQLGIRKNEKGSLGVAFAMGALSALLAGACVAPVLIATLLYAQTQYAAGNPAALALPFLLGVGMAAPWPFAGAGLSFLPKPGGWMDWVKKGMGAFVVVLGVYYLSTAWGIYQQRNVDPAAVSQSAKEASEHGWETSLAAGLAKAKAEKKPVLVDFWATWCKNCLLMNNTVLKDEAVLKRLDGFVKIKYQAEDPTASPTKEIWEHFKLVGLPTYVILKPE